MQEHQDTAGGVDTHWKHPSSSSATENPIEQEGTYHLPEAQLDRVMFEVVIDYPAAEEEHRIVAETTANRAQTARPVMDGPALVRVQEVAGDVPAVSNIVEFATRILRSSRPNTGGAVHS